MAITALSTDLPSTDGNGVDPTRNESRVNLLTSMLEAIPGAVIAIDREQHVLFANRSAHGMFRVEPKLQHNSKLCDVARHEALIEAVQLALDQGGTYQTEFETPRPRRVLGFRSQPLDGTSGDAIVVFLEDVTELRHLEKVRQDFFANISHDLKTPISAIKAFTETLIDHASKDPVKCTRFLKRIEEQSDRLLSLVQDMLMLARVESKEPGFALQRVDVRDVVQASVETFRPDSELKGIKLSIRLCSEACPVLVDLEGMQVILRNLVDNAVKYTPAGGAIDVSVTRNLQEVLIAVSDTGIGIPPQDLSRVFERFYRVDKARSRQMGGTGLGLSIVKHLAQTFGGGVGVASTLGEGSTFTVRLPMVPGKPDTLKSTLPQKRSITGENPS
jgi:two-component system phosphate regulon sensor histidine kinase PhoR